MWLPLYIKYLFCNKKIQENMYMYLTYNSYNLQQSKTS